MLKRFNPGELDTLREYVGPDVLARLHANRHICMTLDDGSYLIAFHFWDILHTKTDGKITIYCSPLALFFFCDNEICIQLINGIHQHPDPFHQLLEFFQSLTSDDIYKLEKMENNITRLEEYLLTKEKLGRETTSKIIALRRELLLIKRYYDQLGLVTGALIENENKVLSADLLKGFVYLNRRIDHLLDSVLHLREYITQVREAYQAQIDIEQNQIMRIFTVITSIFLPLTLLVGWYGMNLKMPEYVWDWGYPFVAALSVVICSVLIFMFKRKKWF